MRRRDKKYVSSYCSPIHEVIIEHIVKNAFWIVVILLGILIFIGIGLAGASDMELYKVSNP